VAFDDVTDLVSAQRMAAWGDVARRIAHEIKNPLTPIQLSAERISRKFGKRGVRRGRGAAQMTDVIVRQTGDLRRIVDEFSKFARMPEPETAAARMPETALVRCGHAAAGRPAGRDDLRARLPDPDHGRARCHDDRAGADQPHQERRRSD
jgi:two-component system nitrogen regulation sensor histidine kinase NtrY